MLQAGIILRYAKTGFNTGLQRIGQAAVVFLGGRGLLLGRLCQQPANAPVPQRAVQLPHILWRQRPGVTPGALNEGGRVGLCCNLDRRRFVGWLWGVLWLGF
ncbi:MAG: hypothetical protein R3E79_34690 [Caldilineaceae bacterium]